jgi:hypothetical protein
MESVARGSPILPRDSTAVRRISGPSSWSNSSKSETAPSLDEGGESWTQPARQRTDRTTEYPMLREDARQSWVQASGRLMKTAPQLTLA